MTSHDTLDGTTPPDACPHCGDRMLPVLHGHPANPSGPLLADPPVRLECPRCAPGD